MKFPFDHNLVPATGVGRWLLVLTVAGITGCAPSGPQVVPVSGTITKDGQPVTNASVTFYAATGRPSYVKTDGAGRYSLEYSANVEGAVVGDHTVVITTSDNGPPPAADLDEPSARGSAPHSAANNGPIDVTLPEAVTVTADMVSLDLVIP